MNDPKQLWEQVGENLGQVGRRLKEHYERESTQAGDTAKVEDALKNLADAVGVAFDAVGSAVKDESFRQEVSKAARTFGEALATTFDEVGDAIREKVNKRSSDG